MNWDQIENNWVAMTRRVRPERSERPATGVPRADARQPSGDMAETATDWPERTATSAVSASRLIA